MSRRISDDVLILVDYCYLQWMVKLYASWGKPVPAHYIINAFNSKPDAHIKFKGHQNVGEKAFLQYVREYTPLSYYHGEMINHDGDDDLYFVKKDSSDNGEGMEIKRFSSLPSVVPTGLIIQKEVSPPKLIQGYKFDLRVLLCVCRDGNMFIYPDIKYRFSGDQYDGANLEKAGKMTNSCMNSKSKNFFASDQERRYPEIEQLTPIYWKQIKEMVPRIYAQILPKFNQIDKIPEDQLGKYFYIHGIDLIADANDRLNFLEINHPPGWDCDSGMNHYHDFWDQATEYIKAKVIYDRLNMSSQGLCNN